MKNFEKKNWKNLTNFSKIFEIFLSQKIEKFKKFFLVAKIIFLYFWDQNTTIWMFF